MGNSALTERILEIRNQYPIKVEDIRKELENIERKIRKKENREEKEKLYYSLDKIIFIDEIVSVKFNNVKHYSQIIKKGFYVNGKKYVRLMSSAGQARQTTVIFVEEKIYEKIDEYLDGGRNSEYKITLAKYNAYYGLSASGGHRISIPRFAVVPDYKFNRLTKVEFSIPQEKKDPIVEERELDLEVVPFDGQGLGSPSFFNSMAFELDMDYIPCAAIFRGLWQKGMIVKFDFHEFARRNDFTKITDIYGKEYNIFELDVILTESQFKLSGAYSSIEEYNKEVEKRDYGWRIARTTPKKDKNIVFTNYQYLQCLNIDKGGIERLCSQTVKYFEEVSKLSYEKMMIFLLGSLDRENIDEHWFMSLENLSRILLFNPKLFKDKFVVNKIQRLITKQIRDSYIGRLRVDGNYQFMISDPYAFAEYIFGMNPKGLLNKRQFYSKYWNDKQIDRVAALRSPMTWKSEINVLDLKKNEDTEFWYKDIYSGIIYNIFDDSTMLHAGSD
jgi:hypothetical protein